MGRLYLKYHRVTLLTSYALNFGMYEITIIVFYFICSGRNTFIITTNTVGTCKREIILEINY